MTQPEVLISKLREDAIIPHYRHMGDSGFDLCSVDDVDVPPGSVKILPTGLAIALPAGLELQLRLRSSTALNTPLIMPNAPATIDSGYRGEIGIIVRNIGAAAFLVQKGWRLAQGIIAPVVRPRFVECEELPESSRGSHGYGSTGQK